MYRVLTDDKVLKTAYKQRYHKLQWYCGGATEKTHSAQDTVFSMTSATDTAVKKIKADGVQEDGSAKDLHLWSTVPTQILPQMLKKNWRLQELLLLGRQTKVYFDVDGKADKSLRVRAFEAIREVFPNGKIRRHGYETENKFSDHYVVSNRTFMFEDTSIRDMKIFCKELNAANAFPENFIDTAVYTKHRPMKMVNQSKPRGQPSLIVKINDDDDDAGKHLIQSNFDDDTADAFDDIHAWYISKGLTMQSSEPIEEKVSKRKPKDGEAAPQRKVYGVKDLDFDGKLIPQGFNYHSATPRERVLAVPSDSGTDHFLNLFMMHYAKHFAEMTFDQFWNGWLGKQDKSPARRTKWQAEWNHRSPRAPYANRLRDMYERAAKASGRDFFQRPEFDRFKAMYDFEPTIVTSHYINEPHPDTGAAAPLELPTAKHTFICASTGAGKSQYIYDLVERCGVDRVLYLAPNKGLIKDLAARFENTPIPYARYDDVKYRAKDGQEQLREAARIICTPNSVHKLAGLQFDLVVLDESERLWSGLANRVFHGTPYEQNVQVINELRRGAKWCIDMDAFLSKRSLDMATDDTPPVIISNTTTMNKTIQFVKETKKYELESGFNRVVLESLARGKKVFYFLPRPKQIDEFCDLAAAAFGWTVGTEIKKYHAEMPKTDLDNIERVWGHNTVKLVVANTCLGVGVNFSTKDCFDDVFGTHEPWLPVNDFLQALARVRHPRNPVMKVFIRRKWGSANRGVFTEAVGKGFKEADYYLANVIRSISEAELTSRSTEIVTETIKVLEFLAERNGIRVMQGEREEFPMPEMIADVANCRDWDKIAAEKPSSLDDNRSFETRLGETKYCLLKWAEDLEYPLTVDDVIPNITFKNAEDVARYIWDRGLTRLILEKWNYLYKESSAVPPVSTTGDDLLRYFKTNTEWRRNAGVNLNHVVRDVIERLNLTFHGTYDNDLKLDADLLKRIRAEFKLPYLREGTKHSKIVAQLINNYFAADVFHIPPRGAISYGIRRVPLWLSRKRQGRKKLRVTWELALD